MAIAIWTAALLGTAGSQAGTPISDLPLAAPSQSRWALTIESAQLFGVNNPRDYHLAPQIVSLVYLAQKRSSLARLDIRSEFLFSLIAEPVLHGPETHYFAGAIRRRWIFSLPDSRWGFHFDAGFGAGAIDSTDDPFGQGQDFTFALLFSVGVDLAFNDRLDVSFSVFYQHLSNGGLSEPDRKNVGLDAFGPALGLRWQF